jgi:tetratricopeptide (TPR) repeat protein
MTTKSLLQPRFRTLRAVAFGLSIGFAAPVFADNLPDIQRLIKQGQHAQALEKVDAYLSSRPKDAQGRFLKGLIFTEMNRSADAINVFTKLSEDYPELPEPYNNLAVLYAQQKQYDKARTALEMAIRTHPAYAIAYENLGDIYAKLASQAYDKALQFDGGNTATQNKLALIRDLITTSGKGNVKPTASAPAVSAPPPVVATAPTPAPAQPVVKQVATATVVATTPGAAAPAINEAKPTPPPAPAIEAKPVVRDAASDDVAKALATWANAWSRKDMKAYLATYSSDFNTPKGVSRSNWEKEREQRIGARPGKISVTYDEPSISINGDRATVRFKQHYKAPGMSSSSNKTLVFVRAGSKWLIKEENAR